MQPDDDGRPSASGPALLPLLGEEIRVAQEARVEGGLDVKGGGKLVLYQANSIGTDRQAVPEQPGGADG